MRKTVVIPAAGLGSRLDEFTKNYNKAMCTLGPKPVISYIIEKFTKEDEIIILLGYKGDLLKQVVQICYPDWNIQFVNVDCFEGPGSGLGYSLSCAKELLQKPFMFWSNDSIIDEDIDDFDFSENFLVLAPFDAERADSYRHAAVGKRDVSAILRKGEYDETGKGTLPYIGISFIKDYEKFWEACDKNFELFVNAGESAGLNNLKKLKYFVTKTWLDTGNKQSLIKAKEEYSKKMEATILEKPDEAIWFFDDRVVKFHIDPSFIDGRVKRWKLFINDKMKENNISIPELITYNRNVYSYKMAEGKIMSLHVDDENFKELMHKVIDSVTARDVSDEYKRDMYLDFYRDKTLKRIEKYCKEWEDPDKECVINGVKCLPAKDIINSIDWEKISTKAFVTDNYHGDFHLENILTKKNDKGENEYIMLDWRQNFGKTFDGDFYYDLGKMWHSLIVNHNMVKDNLFTHTIKADGKIVIDIHRTFIDTQCEKLLIEVINTAMDENNLGKFDVEHAKFITALIFLNICSCHVGTYGTFLFYLGKYLMNKFIQRHPYYLK